jgi:hypothetical protein
MQMDNFTGTSTVSGGTTLLHDKMNVNFGLH